MDTKKAYQEKLEAQKKQLDVELEKTKAKLSEAKADFKIEYQKQLEDAQRLKSEIVEVMKDLQECANESWDVIKENTKKTYTDIEKKFQQLINR